MASLSKDARTGLYYAQFYDADQAPTRKSVPLKTRRRRTAVRALVRLEDGYAAGDYDPWAPEEPEAEDDGPALERIAEAREAYLDSCSHLRPRTVETYSAITRRFRDHVGEDFPVANLRAKQVRDWIDTTDANDVTRRKYVKHLGYFFRFLVRKGAMERDLSKEVKLRQVPQKHPKFMTPEQVDQLVDAIRAHMKKHEGNPKVPDYTWLIRLIRANVYLGLRRGELIHLRWEHVDLEARRLRVANTDDFTTKSSKERTLPLAQPVVAVLEEARETRQDGYVFQSHKGKLKASGLSHAFLRFRRKADLPEGISLHSTRHTALSWLAQRGAGIEAIRRYAGHSTVTVTERYMHLTPEAFARQITGAFAESPRGKG